MAVTPLSLQPGMALQQDLQTVFTAPGGTTVVTSGVAANSADSITTLSVSVTRAGGQAVFLIPARQVATMGTDLLPELSGLVLNKGDVLSAGGAGLQLVLNGYSLS
ncbi:hypothetical protein E3E11_06615 [Oecophyllibacter saccharovorans]|uniref:hypothetical protein n=1 Tax=Oecophyllibacter saccharovorans TaxID=2558360 RepID=UPI0011437A5C|nr:hypothetical protein [Oecophyllibacter saccharovorans]QDH15577.1 hypothetical protein E3E11_06615 [Oecophyllibacter saccharovorans]